ncbi:NADH-quinone oxidoreductase subunit NuoG [Kushneria phosphatilytica]|uniref:NADH-quinone oxidoreductase n=1 Tax=Kushneria phosphatilytica TaxID=657387 RepID=A0A1S1NSP0_9GAMM|nr:NADH-quinone oxidoreductase subunit NuoG [Kushneria phosphatilytica]OHV08363.1 NADH-quinone oxidoreductase subunit G [Kushneria phosphatilytica]QEL09785.1 NADH-quinone oxidoreductase subunit NuoG [Kushneria phosphatilytica]
MATIHVDGKDYEVDGSDNLLHACLSLGLDIPYFCWHPAMGSVGACRQCAVKQYKDADDTRGTLVMSCMAPVKDDAYISIEDDEAKDFRASVIEWLMTNHPHDCPVCEEGGHCHLQDMTVMTGHDRRRYRFAKRTHRNQNLGPFIAHEMNRCITCYRCVRFYKDYAGGEDLGAFGAHENIYFGRTTDGTLENEFSGNLTEVCPTGVFTDQTHSEHYTRKWDMQFAPSICHGCSSGCNISPGERYGEVRRIENRYNGEVNHYFLCDRGRFGYGYVNRPDRPRQPVMRVEHNGERRDELLDVGGALDHAAERLKKAQRVIGIGSPRASLESNHVLRELVGAENFSTGIAQQEYENLQLMLEIQREGALPTPTMRDIEDHDAVIVLGEDLMQTAARVALAVRQSANSRAQELASEIGIPAWNANAVNTLAQGRKYPVFLATLTETRMDDLARDRFHGSAEEIARLGFAVAHAIDNSAPAVEGLDEATQTLASTIAEALMTAERPLIISGGSLGSREVIQAAANLARALRQRDSKGSITLVSGEANSTGLAMLGGHSLDWALDSIGEGDAVVVLENDLYARADDERVDRALDNAECVLCADHQSTPTWLRADIGLPSATFAEGDGTLVSHEGRAQRFFQVYDPSYYRPNDLTHESWRWLHALHTTMESRRVDWTQLDEVTEDCAAHHPQLAGIRDAAPSASFRIKGQKLAREPHRYSGRTAMRANISVSEPRAPQDVDSAFTFSMEGYNGYAEPRSQVAFAWAPGWNSPQAWNKFQDEVGGHLTGSDPGNRLFDHQPANRLSYFEAVPGRFEAREGAWRVARLPHLFGSDEMSARAEPIQQRMSEPYVALSEADAQRLGVAVGTELSLSIGHHRLTLPLRISSELREGILGLPALPNMPVAVNHEWAHLGEETKA